MTSTFCWCARLPRMEKTARPEIIDVRKSKDEIVAAVMCTLIMWMMVMIMMMMTVVRMSKIEVVAAVMCTLWPNLL